MAASKRSMRRPSTPKRRRTWLDELTTVSTALHHEIKKRESRRLSGAASRLERSLRQASAERERLERRHREAARGLREVRERFEIAFGSAPIGMALIDMDGRWLQVNTALCRITGHTQDELKATTLAAITHPEDIALDAEDRQELLAGRISSYQVEKRYLHAWGH
jgi:PAS domain S-box-containing protein